MMLHSYPLLISIYKGEGRMLIVPLIDHIAGYNHYVRVKINEDNQYIIHSMKKSHKRQYTYDEIIKEFILFADADAEEIGKAVIESFMESERYYNMG